MAQEDEPVGKIQSLTDGLIATVPAGFVHVSIDGSIEEANPEALRVLGLSQDELTNRITQDFETETVFEDGRPCSVEEYPVTKALMTGEPQPPVTIGVKQRDGSVHWAVFRAVPVVDQESGQTTGAVVTFLDITDRKRFEQELERQREQLLHSQRIDSLGQLAGGVAHDFNNLLQVIIGNSDFELRHSGGSQRIGEIRMAAERAAELTSKLLTFGRRQPFEVADVDPRELVHRLAPLLRRMLGERVTLRVVAGPGATTVKADMAQLEQVLTNLCINARDAMPDGGVITLKLDDAELTEPAKRELGLDPTCDYQCLAVSDTGQGIDESIVEHVFEPFFTTKPVGAGTGLGLSVVYGIVRQHGGAIAFDSEAGQGTTFKVYLPESDRPSQEMANPLFGGAVGGTEGVLVVEDQPMVRKLVADILSNAGYSVLTANNGKSALDVLAKSPDDVDIVVSDIVMPIMDGHELAKELAESMPAKPVLLTTGHEMNTAADGKAGDAGSAPTLYKPYGADALLNKVRELLDHA